MELTELNALIDKTATLMVQYERRGAVVEARLRALDETLKSLAGRLPEVVRVAADDIVRSVPAELAEGAAHGLERPLGEYRAQLQSAGDEVTRSAQSLAAQIARLRGAHRLLVWEACGALAVALALLLGGGAWLAAHYAGVVRANQVSAEVMQAYNRADVVLCGKGELCANVDAKRSRYGAEGQYLRVKRR